MPTLFHLTSQNHLRSLAAPGMPACDLRGDVERAATSFDNKSTLFSHLFPAFANPSIVFTTKRTVAELCSIAFDACGSFFGILRINFSAFSTYFSENGFRNLLATSLKPLATDLQLRATNLQSSATGLKTRATNLQLLATGLKPLAPVLKLLATGLQSRATNLILSNTTRPFSNSIVHY